MIDLAIPVHPNRTSGLDPRRYIERIAALGATAVELQLSPVTHEQLRELRQLLNPIAGLGLRCHLHVPTRLAESSDEEPDRIYERWKPVVELAAAAAEQQRSPVHLVIHPAGGPEDHPGVYIEQTAALVRWMLTAAGSIHPMLELVLAGQEKLGLRQRIRRWGKRQRERRGQVASPPGTVREGLGGPRLTARRPTPGEEDGVEPCLVERCSAGGSRSMLLATLEQIGDKRAGICWDLGHDWWQSRFTDEAGWSSLPSPHFLSAVRHVHLHDALPDGHLHLPLQTGYVPYTTQLRALLGAGFTGTITLEIFFDRLALSFGTRFELLERSLATARSILRLSGGTTAARGAPSSLLS